MRIDINITEQQWRAAFEAWKPRHVAAPCVEDILELRLLLADYSLQDLDSICLFYLRNEFVRNRKRGIFKDARRTGE
jgi:hypothetical protein